MAEDNSLPRAVQPWRIDIAADAAHYLGSLPTQPFPIQVRQHLARLGYADQQIEWLVAQQWFTMRMRQARLNIPAADRKQIEQKRKTRAGQRQWTDRIRDTVECPRCHAPAGEYCEGRHGKPMISVHPRRRKLYLLSPSELAPPEAQPATPSHS